MNLSELSGMPLSEVSSLEVRRFYDGLTDNPQSFGSRVSGRAVPSGRFRRIGKGLGRFEPIDRLGLSADIPVGTIPGAQADGLCKHDPVTFAFEFQPVAGETIDFEIGADSTALGVSYEYSRISVGGVGGDEVEAVLGDRLPIGGGESALTLSGVAPSGVRSLVVVSMLPAGEARMWINGQMVDRVDGGDAVPAPGWAGNDDGRLAVSAGADLTGSRVSVYAGQFPQALWDGV